MANLFHYVSACAGSGKTTSAIAAMAKGVKQGHKFVVAQPTKQLIENTISNQRNAAALAGLKIAVITSDRYPGSTHSEFIKAVNEAKVDIIFTSHSTIMSCWNIANKGKFDLIVDEIPSVDVPFHANLSLTWDDWMKHVTTTEADDEDALLVHVKAGSEEKIQNWAWNELADDVIAVTQSFWEMIINPNYHLSITKADWQTAGYQGTAKLHAHGTLLPSILSGWNRVTIMGANFENSFMNIVWSSMGVEFRPDIAITIAQPKHSAKTGSRARIHYFTERDWSKYLRNQIGFHVIADKLAEHINGPHIWAANVDVADYMWKAPESQRLSPVSHGLNSYVEYDKAIFLAALNDTPAHSKWLQTKYGLAPDEIGKAKAFEAAYQMVMRTNLRSENGSKNVDIYVADRRTADYLNKLLPGSKQNFLDLGLTALGDSKRDMGRVAPKLSQSERNKASKEKKAAYKSDIERISQSLRQLQMVARVSEIAPMMSIEARIDSTEVHTERFSSFDAIRDTLAEMYAKQYKSKDENLLISGATFSKTADSETTKGLDAFVYSQILQLDFDDSEMDPDLAQRLFADIKHIAYNSFNNGRDGLHRYRIFIPLAEPVTVEGYEMLWDVLASRVIAKGYDVGKAKKGKASGLDTSKRTPVSFMYGPCQANNRDFSFWKPNWEAAIMDPIKFIDRAPAEQPEYVEHAPIDNRSERVRALSEAVAAANNPNDAEAAERASRLRQGKFEQALSKWQSSPAGEGNDAFFAFGRQLQYAGFSLLEIEQLLNRHHAESSSNTADRKAQINSIINSLKRYSA